ncbi:MAG TPA: hypothetical protein VK858_07845 [Longimicrobiales bacterium]|nr:hypothetical protein [Longimicrobiales bacterium]
MTRRALGWMLGFGGIVALAACGGGVRGANFTPEELAAMRSVGSGNCRAVIQNFSGRRVEAFYQTGIEERKVRNAIDVWPLIGYIDIGESLLLRAPCEERQVVIGWRQDIGQAFVFPGGVVQRETLIQDGILGIRLRLPSQASCSTDNASSSIRGRCLLPGGGE